EARAQGGALHEHRDGSIDRDRGVRVRFCAGPVEYATKPLSTPTGGKIVPCSLKSGNPTPKKPRGLALTLSKKLQRSLANHCNTFAWQRKKIPMKVDTSRIGAVIQTLRT